VYPPLPFAQAGGGCGPPAKLRAFAREARSTVHVHPAHQGNSNCLGARVTFKGSVTVLQVSLVSRFLTMSRQRSNALRFTRGRLNCGRR